MVKCRNSESFVVMIDGEVNTDTMELWRALFSEITAASQLQARTSSLVRSELAIGCQSY